MKIVAWDSTERGAPYLTTWWALGAAVLSGADIRVGVASWLHLVRVVTDQAARANSQVQLQLWSHGSPGLPVIDGRGPTTGDLDALCTDLQQVWWRACSVHRGTKGHAFARGIAGRGVESVGHTEIISAPLPWRQRGICGLRAAQTPWWPQDGAGLRSCSTTRMSPPRWCWRPS